MDFYNWRSGSESGSESERVRCGVVVGERGWVECAWESERLGEVCV